MDGGAAACETAAALLGMADEAGLSHLRAVALDFVVMHFGAVAKTTAWANLPRACADAVTAEVSSHLSLQAKTCSELGRYGIRSEMMGKLACGVISKTCFGTFTMQGSPGCVAMPLVAGARLHSGVPLCRQPRGSSTPSN